MPQRNRDDSPDDSRRDFLVRALSLGVLAGGTGWSRAALAGLFGKLPGRLPEGQSVFEMTGDVRINGKPADRSTRIGPADTISTGANSYLIAAVGSNAFIVRDRSVLELNGGANAVKSVFRLITGKFLGVFGHLTDKQSLTVSTPQATIGIRGTGLYAESDADKTYLCTCYGTTDLASVADAKSTERIVSKHHDAPRYILAAPENGQRIVPAPFINHTDLELMTLEAIVGRKVPFGLPDPNYERPRRDY